MLKSHTVPIYQNTIFIHFSFWASFKLSITGLNHNVNYSEKKIEVKVEKVELHLNKAEFTYG